MMWLYLVGALFVYGGCRVWCTEECPIPAAIACAVLWPLFVVFSVLMVLDELFWR